MNNNRTLTLALSLFSFFLLTAQPPPQVEVQNGLRSIRIKTEAGAVVLFLPERLYAGALFSGSVHLEPAGRNARQQERNRRRLESYTLVIAGQPAPLSRTFFRRQAPAGNATAALELNDAEGKSLIAVSLQVLPQAPRPSPSLHAPAYLRAGQAEKLAGPFDGQADNTALELDGRPVDIVAEGPGELFFETPAEASGPVRMRLREGDTALDEEVNVVDLQLSAGSVNLRRGQSTAITLTLTGLQGLEEPVTVSLTNQLPENISLGGGEVQTITVEPAETGPEGTFTTQRTVTARRPGGFTVRADIAAPPSGERLSGLLPCQFNDVVYLLDCATCTELGGECREAMAAPDRTYPGTETGPPPLGLAWETPPPADVEVGQPITAVIRPTDEVLAVRYSYRRLQSDYWQTIPLPESSTMTALHWNTVGLTPGAYVLQVSIAADEGRNVTTSAYFQVSGAVTYSLDEQTIADMSDEELRDSLNAVRDRIRQLERDSAVEERAAENEAARQRILERQLEEAIRRQEEQDSILQAHRLIFARLREIDRRLERVEDAYGERVDSLVQALRRAGQAATPPDLDGLKGALAAAEANLRICEEQRRDLQNQIDAVRARIDSRHEAVLAVAKEVTDMMTRHGWTAGYHEWPDGRVGFGGVGDEAHTLRRGHPDYEPFWELFYKGKDLNKEIRKLNQQLDGLEANLRSLDDCRRQAEAVEAARRALETGRTARQQRNELDQICEEINMLLGTLQSFCGEHPGICTAALLARLEALLEACPSPEAWDAFFRQLEGAVAVKAGIEEGYGRRVSTDSTRAADAAETVDRLRKELAASANAEASRRDRAAAHRDALARARAARRAMEAEEAARREIRNRPKPVTPYPEPVPFSDTELKGTAHAALLRLADKVARVDAVIKHGTDCTCELNALRAADIAIVQQVLGKLGVEVMFAPLSALPAGKGAKLGMSLLKDFANSVFGGGNLTEDATKTLLKFAGGEVFGKLLDSEFFGEQAAGLSVEAANRLLKSMAGDLQAFSWDGDVQVQCRHPDERWISLNVSVNGLYNEATGWAVLRIETDDPDCKGYLVKFRVDEEGVLIGDSVRTQELP